MLKRLISGAGDDTKLSDAVDMTKGWDAIQRGLDKLKRWAHEDPMMFNKAKCKVLHAFIQYSSKMGEKWIGNSPDKDGLGFWA
ncbi:hypothetical protein DUI87_16816 [Hirundo rustica rustica]|uniref:Uncharacterized protein n=1 Tax=Hirundo rustica rustica TaxID=333673 RepID=A0A3M0K7Q0_HIRRU|nr:hypothetical protein DUI87_16816 [Hirundo rustica rustica]